MIIKTIMEYILGFLGVSIINFLYYRYTNSEIDYKYFAEVHKIAVIIAYVYLLKEKIKLNNIKSYFIFSIILLIPDFLYESIYILILQFIGSMLGLFLINYFYIKYSKFILKK